MKTSITLLLSFFLIQIYAQNVHIPDANFKGYLVNNVAVNLNGDSEIQVTEAEAFTEGLTFNFYLIEDLTGIEAFINLTFLDCGRNNLTTIDISSNIHLEQFYCYDNDLTEIDLSNNPALVALDCRDNLISDLDLSDNPLIYYVNCPFNEMETINVSQNPLLETLRCYSNSLETLDVTQNPNLLTLTCGYNDLMVLDTSNNIALDFFDADYNDIIDLDLSSNIALGSFSVNGMPLESLNLANGNNENMRHYNSILTPNLECIQVDNAMYSEINWTSVDPISTFSEDCTPLNTPDQEFDSLTFSPNPVRNSMHINNKYGIEINLISLYDSLGKKIKSFISGLEELNMMDVRAGIYFLQVHTQLGSKTIKIIKV